MSKFLEDARKRHEQAERNYNSCPSNLHEIQLNHAWANLEQAKKTLARVHGNGKTHLMGTSLEDLAVEEAMTQLGLERDTH